MSTVREHFEVVRQRLYAAIKVLPAEIVGAPAMTVGNTGLTFFTHSPYIQRNWELQYLPEGYNVDIPDRAKQYALTFLYGLHHFIDWWKNVENFRGLPFLRHNLADGITTENFASFLTRHVGKACSAWSLGSAIYFSLNLGVLSEDEMTLSMLGKASQVCEEMKYSVLEDRY